MLLLSGICLEFFLQRIILQAEGLLHSGHLKEIETEQKQCWEQNLQISKYKLFINPLVRDNKQAIIIKWKAPWIIFY